MVAAQTMSTPISVGPCWAPEKAAKTRLLFIGRPALNLERNHARHDEGAEAHPDEPAAAGDHQPLFVEEAREKFGGHHPEDREDEKRQRPEDIGRRLGFGRHSLEFALHLDRKSTSMN